MDNLPKEKVDLTRTIFHCIVSVTLFIFIGVLLVCSIYYSFSINSSQLFLIVIMVFIALSFVFDKLTLGTLLSVDRHVKKLEKEQHAIKEDNHKFREEILKTLLVNINQIRNSSNNSTHVSVGGVPAIVTGNEQQTNLDQSANEEDDQANPSNKEQRPDTPPPQSSTQETQTSFNTNKKDSLSFVPNSPFSRQYTDEELDSILANAGSDKSNNRYFRVIESAALNTVASKRGFSTSDLSYEVKISLPHPNNVSKSKTTFDAYTSNNIGHFFLEVLILRNSTSVMMRADRLYRQLSEVQMFSDQTGVPAKLVLILVPVTNERGSGLYETAYNQLNKSFEPALFRGLLELDIFIPTKENLVKTLGSVEAAATKPTLE